MCTLNTRFYDFGRLGHLAMPSVMIASPNVIGELLLRKEQPQSLIEAVQTTRCLARAQPPRRSFGEALCDPLSRI